MAVVMGDHEIDLIDAKQDDNKRIEKTEVGREIRQLAENQVFRHPDPTGHCYQDQQSTFPGPEKSPDPELPKDQQPFGQRVNITDNGIAAVYDLDDEIPLTSSAPVPTASRTKKGW